MKNTTDNTYNNMDPGSQKLNPNQKRTNPKYYTLHD